MVTSGLFWFEIKVLLAPLARNRFFIFSFFCHTMITSDLLLVSNKISSAAAAALWLGNNWFLSYARERQLTGGQ